MQALGDGGGIDEEAAAKGTADVWIKLIEGELGLWESKRITVSGYSFKIAMSPHLHHMTSCLPQKLTRMKSYL